MKKLILSVLVLIPLSLSAQQEGAKASTGGKVVKAKPPVKDHSHASHELPADFPKFQDTGDPKADQERYQLAKQQWIAAHPEAYQRLIAKRTEQPVSTEPRVPVRISK